MRSAIAGATGGRFFVHCVDPSVMVAIIVMTNSLSCAVAARTLFSGATEFPQLLSFVMPRVNSWTSSSASGVLF